MLPTLRIDFSLTSFDVDAVIKGVREDFEEAFAKCIQTILNAILQDAPKGLPVLTGQAKRGFEDIAEHYGVPVDYTTHNILDIKEFEELFDPYKYPSNAVTESIREDKGFREWNMDIGTDHFLKNDATNPGFKRVQKKMPWNLLDKVRGEAIVVLRQDLVKLIGKTMNRWKVKATRTNPHLK